MPVPRARSPSPSALVPPRAAKQLLGLARGNGGDGRERTNSFVFPELLPPGHAAGSTQGGRGTGVDQRHHLHGTAA